CHQRIHPEVFHEAQLVADLGGIRLDHLGDRATEFLLVQRGDWYRSHAGLLVSAAAWPAAAATGWTAEAPRRTRRWRGRSAWAARSLRSGRSRAAHAESRAGTWRPGQRPAPGGMPRRARRRRRGKAR